VLSTLHLKRFCVTSLLFLILAPAVVSWDGEIGILAFLFNQDPYDVSISSLPDVSTENHDCDVTTLLSQFDEAQVSPIYIFELAVTSAFLVFVVTANRTVSFLAVPAGRGPPSV